MATTADQTAVARAAAAGGTLADAFTAAKRLARPADLFHPRHDLLRSMYGEVPDYWPAEVFSTDEWLEILETAKLPPYLTMTIVDKMMLDIEQSTVDTPFVSGLYGAEIYGLLEIVLRGDNSGHPVSSTTSTPRQTLNAAGRPVTIAASIPLPLIESNSEMLDRLATAKIVPVYPAARSIEYGGCPFVPTVTIKVDVDGLSPRVRAIASKALF